MFYVSLLYKAPNLITFFVWRLTVVYTSDLNPLPPAPPKLRPYGAL